MTLRAIFASAVLLGISICCRANSADLLGSAVRAYSKHAVATGYRFAKVDLNDDGQTDALVLLNGDYCGSGGCNLLVFRGSSTGFKFVSWSTISREPIGVLNEKSHGWKTLLVGTGGIGSVVMRFNGVKYPPNPSMQVVATKEQMASAMMLKFEDVDPSGK